MNKILIYVSINLLLCFSVSAQTMKLSGKITEVIDGNTLLLDASRNTFFKIRLQFIDPPEESQPLYDVVKKHLSSFVLHKSVVVEVKFMANGYHVGKVLADGRDLSMQLLRDGAAWYSHPEAAEHAEKERNEYLEMESQAKAEKRGIWGIADITPAWKIRTAREKAAKEQIIAERDEVLERIKRSGNRLPTKPVIGMTFVEFDIVCGSQSNDSMKVIDTPAGQSIDLFLAFSDKRATSMCFGYFHFENRKLKYISRSN